MFRNVINSDSKHWTWLISTNLQVYNKIKKNNNGETPCNGNNWTSGDIHPKKMIVIKMLSHVQVEIHVSWGAPHGFTNLHQWEFANEFGEKVKSQRHHCWFYKKCEWYEKTQYIVWWNCSHRYLHYLIPSYMPIFHALHGIIWHKVTAMPASQLEMCLSQKVYIEIHQRT